jgi:hypothetical protein
MTAFFNARTFAAAAVAGLVTLGGARAAKADVIFHNLTTQPIHFTMACTSGGGDAWTIDPLASGAIYCKNDSPAAVVVIRTNHGGYDEVVRRVVVDGSSYNIGYDRAGDVSIAPS